MAILTSTADNASAIQTVASAQGKLTISNSTVNGFDVVEDLTNVKSVYILSADNPHDYKTVFGTYAAGTFTYDATLTSAATVVSNEEKWLDASLVVSDKPTEIDVVELDGDGANNASVTTIVPAMTSDTAPSGTAFASSTSKPAYLAFDQLYVADVNNWATADGGYASTCGYINTVAKVVNKVIMRSNGADTNRCPSNFTIEASNDTTTGADGTWDTLSTVVGATGWANGVDVVFTFTNTTPYLAYRINVSTIVSGTDYTMLTKLFFTESTATGSTSTSLVTTTPIATGDSVLLVDSVLGIQPAQDVGTVGFTAGSGAVGVLTTGGSAISITDSLNVSKVNSDATWTNSNIYGDLINSSGLYHWEFVFDGNNISGVATTNTYQASCFAFNTSGYGAHTVSDVKYLATGTSSAYGTVMVNGDVVGVTYNYDTGDIYVYKNGVSEGLLTSLTANTAVYPAFSLYNSSTGLVFNSTPTHTVSGATFLPINSPDIYSAPISLTNAPTKAFFNNHTKYSLAVEDTDARCIVKADEYLSMLGDTYADIVPTMTSNTTPSGLAFASTEGSVNLQAWEAFDNLSRPSETTGWEATGNTGYIGYKGASKIVTSLTIQAEDNTLGGARSPNTFTLQGSNDTTTGADGTWVTLDSYSGETFTQNEIRTFTTTNTTAYTAYRINVTVNNGDTYLGIKELEFLATITNTDTTNIVTPEPIYEGETLYTDVGDAVLGEVTPVHVNTVNTNDVFGDNSCLLTLTFDNSDLTNLSGNYTIGEVGGAVLYSTGKFGQGAYPNGTSGNRITINDGLFNDRMVVSFWANMTSSANYNWVIGDGGDYIMFRPDTGLNFVTSWTNDVPTRVDWSALPLNTWTHFVCVAEQGSPTKVYINGTEATYTLSGTNNGTTSRTMSEVQLFANSVGTYQFDGVIDQVRVFNRGLTAEEASLLFIEEYTLYSAPHNLGAVTPTTAYRKGGEVLSDVIEVNDEFETVTYTGNGSTQTIPMTKITSGVDFVWAKSRDTGSYLHEIADSIRGAGNYLSSDTTGAEAATGDISSFSANSFNLSGSTGYINVNTDNIVAWCASLPNDNASNTDGTITSVTKSNSFMSAVSYTGTGAAATIGHGLGAIPELIILKSRTGVAGWPVYNAVVGNTKYLELNTTAIPTTLAAGWNNTSPTSSVFTVGTDGWFNANAGNYIAYCFTSVAGKCKVGSYTGTGASGNAVDCGFEPSWVMLKRTDAIGNWEIYDSSRVGGTNSDVLFADTAEPEVDNPAYNNQLSIDGFTPSGTAVNVNGGTYIYLAIAKEAKVANTDDTVYGTNPISGLLKTGDSIQLDNGASVATTNVVEGTHTVTTTGANDEFEAVLYTGNGTSQTVSATNISTGIDFVWAKSRTAIEFNYVWDSIRGIGKSIYTDLTDAEYTDNKITSFGTSDFTIAASGQTNANGITYVAWCASLPNHTVSNTDGTITSETKSNSFMSAVSYTGTGANATIGHGLSTAPELIITKDRETANGWYTYSATLGNNDFLYLNLTNAAGGNTGMWGLTNPTNKVFSVGGAFDTGVATDHIAYCFTSVAGVCKVGSYTGTAAAGSAVDCGFEPAWVMIKRTDSADDWVILDNQRDVNPNGKALFPNSASAETDNGFYDTNFTSTGFEIVSTNAVVNASGGTYIYLAIAKDVDTLVDIPKYTATIPTQASAPTTAKVLDRSVELTTTHTYNATDNDFDVTTDSPLDISGRHLKLKWSQAKAGSSVQIDNAELRLNKVPYVVDSGLVIDYTTLSFSEGF